MLPYMMITAARPHSISQGPKTMKVLNSIAEAIGDTPIVRLSRFASESRHNLYGKCEFLNPGGSIKDRIAFYMVERAEQEGKLIQVPP